MVAILIPDNRMSHNENKQITEKNAYNNKAEERQAEEKEDQLSPLGDNDVQRTLWTPPTPIQQPTLSMDVDEEEEVGGDDTRDPARTRTTTSFVASPPPAVAAAPATTVNVTMSEDIPPHHHSYHKASSFEQRDEHRSAFSIVKQESDTLLDVHHPHHHQSAGDNEVIVSEEQQEKQDQHPVAESAERLSRRDPNSTSDRQPGMPHRIAQRIVGATRTAVLAGDTGTTTEGEPLPYTSPLRYYHQEHSSAAEQHQEEEEEERTSEEKEGADVQEAPYPHPHHPYPQGYSPHQHPPYHHHPHQQYPYYSQGYYHHHHPAMPPPEDRDTSPMTASQYHHHHPHYPSYHHPSQEYNSSHHPPQEYSSGSPYSYYPPASTGGSQQHPYPYHTQHYYPGATPPSSHSVQDTLQDPPLSTITESTKGTTPSSAMASARKPSDEGEESGDGTTREGVHDEGEVKVAEGLELSAPPALPSMEEDDRKPAAASTTGTSAAGAASGTSTPVAASTEQVVSTSTRPIRGILKKETSPGGGQGGGDFEPIPLDQIAAIPVLSSSTPTAGHSSPYAGGAASSPYPHHHHADPYYPHHHHGAYHLHHVHPRHHQAGYPRTHPSTAVSTPPPPVDSQFVAAPRPPRSASVASVASASSSHATSASHHQHVAPPPPLPPRSTPMTTRRQQQQRQQRMIAPSSSGSTTSSAGGEGSSWERRFNELIDFKRTHGHCEVPQNYAENTSLGTWVNKQRMEQKNRIEGKNSSLNDSRMERLQSIGFRWAKRKGQASWNEKFNELVAYKNKFGNCHVPTKYKDNTALGRWVSTQRAEYKKYQEGQVKTSMNADKIRRLESIGFAWFMAL